jgi:dihydrofolate reductase
VRRLVWFVSVSIDGFIARLDGDMSWARVDEELHWHFNDVLASTGAFLEGRKTYELMADHWPTADQDPDASPAVVEFARIWREVPKIVYSRTLESAEHASQIVREVVPEEVQALKEQEGGDLVVGSTDLVSTFLEHDLVDELRLYVHPALIGEGQPLYRGAQDHLWELEEAQPFNNGVVLLRYLRAASPAAADRRH